MTPEVEWKIDFASRCARKNHTQMKSRSRIMNYTSKKEYLENCRERYPSRNRARKCVMIDVVSDTLGWDRKHIIVAISKHSEQPCSKRSKHILSLWMDSYQANHGSFEAITCARILSDILHILDCITAPHRFVCNSCLGRKTKRANNWIKKFVPTCGSPQAFDQSGWFETDTVSHGSDSSSGALLWNLALNDSHSRWTDLAAF